MKMSRARDITAKFFLKLRRILHHCVHVSIGVLLVSSYIVLVLLCFIKLIFHQRLILARKKTNQVPTYGFLHPFASDGGGGERVLWHTICTALNSTKNKQFGQHVLYHTNPAVSIESLEENVQRHFGICCNLLKHKRRNNFRVVYADANNLLPGRYQSLTLYRQAIASVLFVMSCLQEHTPTIFIDTFGVPFAYPLCHLMGVKVLCYVHYPFISSLHLKALESSKTSLYALVRNGYLEYMHILYQCTGSFIDKCAVNSSWTLHHMQIIWKTKDSIQLIFPPVSDVRSSIPASSRLHTIVSVSQFRREKNHPLQLSVFSKLLADTNATFVIIGSVRNRTDRDYLEELQNLAIRLGISDNIKWLINVSNEQRRLILRNSLIGIHTMQDEHFGISIVEYMAAGCISIAHASGGPQTDIIHPAFQTTTPMYDAKATCQHAVGFLATNEASYLQAIHTILSMSESERTKIRHHANLSIQKFSSDTFTNSIHTLIKDISTS